MGGWEESWELLALLFGARRGCPGEGCLPELGVGGPATASPRSSCGSSCSPWVGTGMLGGLLGPPRRAAVEVLGRSSSSAPAGPLDGAGPGAGDPLREAAGGGAAAGLPSRSSATWPSSRSSRRWASLLQRCTATSIRRCTNIAVRFRRLTRSSRTRRSSFSPKRPRAEGAGGELGSPGKGMPR